MRIRYGLEYDANWQEIADEFCEHASDYQAETLNIIGQQFKIWTQDKTKPATYIQLLEIAKQLSDNGKWFIKTLYDLIDGLPVESEEEDDEG